MRRLALAFASCLVAFVGARPTAAEDFPKTAPFATVRWKGDVPEVEIDARWYAALAIDGTPVADIVASCRKLHGDKWDKRFEEDLPEVMHGLGKKGGARRDRAGRLGPATSREARARRGRGGGEAAALTGLRPPSGAEALRPHGRYHGIASVGHGSLRLAWGAEEGGIP